MSMQSVSTRQESLNMFGSMSTQMAPSGNVVLCPASARPPASLPPASVLQLEAEGQVHCPLTHVGSPPQMQ